MTRAFKQGYSDCLAKIATYAPQTGLGTLLTALIGGGVGATAGLLSSKDSKKRKKRALLLGLLGAAGLPSGLAVADELGPHMSGEEMGEAMASGLRQIAEDPTGGQEIHLNGK